MKILNIKYSKHGGMRFLRIGRLQVSWCICKAKSNKGIMYKHSFDEHVFYYNQNLDAEMHYNERDEAEYWFDWSNMSDERLMDYFHTSTLKH